jgi:hypothetical protein
VDEATDWVGGFPPPAAVVGEPTLDVEGEHADMPAMARTMTLVHKVARMVLLGRLGIVTRDPQRPEPAQQRSGQSSVSASPTASVGTT